jgi:hypothetical protein
VNHFSYLNILFILHMQGARQSQNYGGHELKQVVKKALLHLDEKNVFWCNQFSRMHANVWIVTGFAMAASAYNIFSIFFVVSQQIFEQIMYNCIICLMIAFIYAPVKIRTVEIDRSQIFHGQPIRS